MSKNKDMIAFEKFMENTCAHDVVVGVHCQACEVEMMTDFIVHNLEDFTTNEAVQCIREGILTIDELNDRLERRLKVG